MSLKLYKDSGGGQSALPSSRASVLDAFNYPNGPNCPNRPMSGTQELLTP